jgi:hypothetical protein
MVDSYPPLRSTLKAPETLRSEICEAPSKIGEVVLKGLYYRTDRIFELLDMLQCNLSPILTDEYPKCTESASKEEQYPPYYNDLRSVVNRLENIQGRLETLVDRTSQV